MKDKHASNQKVPYDMHKEMPGKEGPIDSGYNFDKKKSPK